jgi:hypothetical protein
MTSRRSAPSYAPTPRPSTPRERSREIREGFAKQGREMCAGFSTFITGMAQITALLTNLGSSPEPLIGVREGTMDE